MSKPETETPLKICETILRMEKQYNVEHNILPSENRIVDRMLARGPELHDAYEELHRELHSNPAALREFLGAVIRAAAHWNPEKIAQARAGRSELIEVNAMIAETAGELASLLRSRSRLNDSAGFSSDTIYSLCQVIEEAGQGNSRFVARVQEPFSALYTQFDGKYWPTISDVLEKIAGDARMAEVEPWDPMTAAATAALRPTLADFVKALFAAIEDLRRGTPGWLPQGFKPTDETVASLVNCALDLAPEDMKNGPYVKGIRQRSRKSGASP